MARPQKKGLDYFPHDATASVSREVEYLEAIHGLAGYSVYMKLLERVYGQEGYYIHWSEMDRAIFAKRCGIDASQLDDIVETCFEADLFSRWVYDANMVLTSKSIQRRYLQATEKRATVEINPEYDPTCSKTDTAEGSKSDAAEVSVEETTAEDVFTENKPSTGDISASESTQRKVKESKEEESKSKPKNSGGRFTPPTVDMVGAYCEERKNTVDPQAWHDHYTSNGWKVGKNSMKDWKAAVRTWESRNNGGINGRNNQGSAGKARGKTQGFGHVSTDPGHWGKNEGIPDY